MRGLEEQAKHALWEPGELALCTNKNVKPAWPRNFSSFYFSSFYLGIENITKYIDCSLDMPEWYLLVVLLRLGSLKCGMFYH